MTAVLRSAPSTAATAAATAFAPAAAEAGVPAAARTALALQAAMLSCDRLDAAAAACARELAQRLGAGMVWFALADGLQLHLVAVSDGSDPAAPGDAQSRLLAACGEVFDQATAVCAAEPPVVSPADPAVARRPPCITRAHAALCGPGQSALGVPLIVGGQPVGVLGLRRDAGAPTTQGDADLLDTLGHLAALIGPVLVLMHAGEQPWHRRLRASVRRWLAADDAPWHRPLRRAVPVAAVLAAAALLWPVAMPVGGHARLEGAVQRVLSAPADGFVQQVHVRPGQAVQAGEPLIDLADQDLQLERQRWQSQLAQHLDALAAAQARADRAQLVQAQSKADEAQAQLDLVDEKLQRSRLVAPFDGLVVQGDLSQQLGAPVKLGAELMTLAPRDRFRVIVEVDERDIARVQLGQGGSLALSALPWDTLPLRVARITPVAAAVDGRNVFEVEAELLARPAGLRPGLQGHAQITTAPAPTLWRWTRRLVESARAWWWEWIG